MLQRDAEGRTENSVSSHLPGSRARAFHFQLCPLSQIMNTFWTSCYVSFPNFQPPSKLKVSPALPPLSCSWHPELSPEHLPFPSGTDPDRGQIELFLSPAHLCWTERQVKLPRGYKDNQESYTSYFFLICFFTQKLPFWRKMWVFYQGRGCIKPCRISLGWLTCWLCCVQNWPHHMQLERF